MLRCFECNEVQATWEQLAKEYNDKPRSPIIIGKIDCETAEDFCIEQGIEYLAT